MIINIVDINNERMGLLKPFLNPEIKCKVGNILNEKNMATAGNSFGFMDGGVEIAYCVTIQAEEYFLSGQGKEKLKFSIDKFKKRIPKYLSWIISEEGIIELIEDSSAKQPALRISISEVK